MAEEKDLISGTPSNGSWATTDYKDTNGNVVYWANGEPQYTVHKSVDLYDPTGALLTRPAAPSI